MTKTEKTQWEFRVSIDSPSHSNGAYGHVNLSLCPIMPQGRSYADDVMDGIYHRDLTIRCQIDANKEVSEPSYGWEICYLRPYTVDLNDATRMVATLKRIGAKVEKLREQIGCARTYGDWCARFAAVLNATVVFYDSDKQEWRYTSGDAAHMLNTKVAEVYQACRKQAGFEVVAA
jgi:hypothetical protein